MRPVSTLIAMVVAGLLLCPTGARAKAKTYKAYGSWSESVGKKGSSGAVQYMANATVKVDGKRLTLQQAYSSERVARLSGRVVSRQDDAQGQTLKVVFAPKRLAETFATSTGSLVESHLVNSFRFPGATVSLGKAAAVLSAEVKLGSDGSLRSVSWEGQVTKYSSQIKLEGWPRGTRGKALQMMKQHIAAKATPLEVKGSFRALR